MPAVKHSIPTAHNCEGVHMASTKKIEQKPDNTVVLSVGESKTFTTPLSKNNCPRLCEIVSSCIFPKCMYPSCPLCGLHCCSQLRRSAIYLAPRLFVCILPLWDCQQ
ncbi:myosin-binding protein H [Platysternon megacephalum]|uniref:Myosin-binding protein H n=1 Tax=Platysternon megacephalum TaxID=55544 RepID=A0A4D9DYF8_9SAUR|nr:myosin-binding protein H [Platysternon megacephalum]